MLIPDKHFKPLVPLGLLLAAFLAYANSLSGDWVWDDASSVLRHEHVQNPRMFFQLFREDQHPFGKGDGNFYRPLVAASFMLDYALTGGNQYHTPPTLLFHLSNLLWHAAASILLFLLLLRLDAPRWVAVATSFLFVLHPLHTEAVAYISGRADMMSAALMLAGLLLALSRARAPWQLIAWGASMLLFAAALLSKESSLIYPALLAIVIFLPPRSASAEGLPRETRLRQAVPLFAAILVMLVYLLLRATVLRFGDGGSTTASPFLQRLVEFGQAFAFYIQKLFLPAGLHMEQTLANTPAWTAVLGWGLLAALLVGLILAARLGQRRITIGLAWFLAAWLPISGLFPLNAPMAEHWMYVPMAGFWWAFCETLCLLAGCRPVLRPALTGAVAVLCLLLLGLTVQRNHDWRSNEALFRATLDRNPGTLRVHYNLAVTYEDLLHNYAGARRHFERVLSTYQAHREASGETRQLLDEEVDVRLSLGNVYFSMGRFPQAAQQYRLLLMGLAETHDPAYYGEAAMGLGRSLLALGEYYEAGAVLSQAAEFNPVYAPQVHALLLGGAPPAPIL